MRRFRSIKRLLAGGLLFFAASALHAQAWSLDGVKRVVLTAKDGTRVDIGSVAFTRRDDGQTAFKLTMDHSRFVDHFLSMREFKCLPGQGEVFCHVPYPYAQPGTVTRDNLAWLEHSLLFMFKLPSEFGAKLWNGVYWRLKLTDKGIVGEPQAVDLNFIGAPPARLDVPPYKPALRDDIAPGARWFGKLTIE